MLLPAIFVIRKDSLSAEWASCSAVWFWPHAFMTFELFHQENWLAPRVEFILTHLRTFFQKMVFNMLHLYHLVTLPACRQHRALLPVVNVKGLLVKWRVVSITKVACCLRISCGWLAVGLLLLVFWRLCFLSISFALTTNVRLDCLLRSSRFFWLLCRNSWVVVNFSKLGH